MSRTSRMIAVFERPFTIPGFDETLPAGEYGIETEDCAPPGYLAPGDWKASVYVKLHTRKSRPGLSRILTVPLSDLERARAKDKASGKELTDVFLEDLLGDPLVLLVMQADGVSEAQLRHLHSGSLAARAGDDAQGRTIPAGTRPDDAAISAAENEGMPR